MPRIADDEESSPDEHGLSWLLKRHRARLAGLSATSAAGGVVEAVFLVAVTRAAFAITEGETTFPAVAGVEVGQRTFVIIALALVAIRLGLAVASARQSARLTTSVVAGIREDLATAYLEASWASQHGERGGRLQELLTTFANQSMTLISAVAQAIVSGFTLTALLLVAIVVDPVSSLAVIGAVALLSLVIRPLRAAVKRQAKHNSREGMDFATSMSEISQLGMEMHVFHVQPSVRARVVRSIERVESVNERLQFLRGLVPAVYSGLAYVALIVALAAVAAIDSADLQTVGAVMLVMLRSLSYGQALQTSAAP